MANTLSVEIGIWISAFMILCIYSWLYKYNKFFKFAESTMIGSAAGYLFIMGYNNIVNTSVRAIQIGKYWHILPILLGVSLFMRYVKNYEWIQRYGTAYLIAGSTAIFIRATIVTQVTQQIAATINYVSMATPMDILNSIVYIVFIVAVSGYFLFSERYSTKIPYYNVINKVGRYGFLTALGYYLGITVMTRIAFVSDRLRYLLFTWLKLSPF